MQQVKFKSIIDGYAKLIINILKLFLNSTFFFVEREAKLNNIKGLDMRADDSSSVCNRDEVPKTEYNRAKDIILKTALSEGIGVLRGWTKRWSLDYLLCLIISFYCVCMYVCRHMYTALI